MRALAVLPALLAAPAAFAQPKPAATPKFEVVSIKPCTQRTSDGNTDGSPGRLRADCVTTESLVRNAYLGFREGRPFNADDMPTRERTQPIKGSNGWIHGERFTLEARADSPVSVEMMRGPMMRTLLADRFKLKIHTEPRDVGVYELTLDKAGHKLQPHKEGVCTVLDPATGPPKKTPGRLPLVCGGFSANPSGGVDVLGITMRRLGTLLSIGMDRDVIDKTGLTGTYDFHLEIAMSEIRFGSPTPSADPSVPSDPTGNLPSALRKVGLRLVPGKRRTGFLVIDHAERPPLN